MVSEIIEALDAEECVTDDEQRPALTEHFERTCEGTILAWVRLTEHVSRLPLRFNQRIPRAAERPPSGFVAGKVGSVIEPYKRLSRKALLTRSVRAPGFPTVDPRQYGPLAVVLTGFGAFLVSLDVSVANSLLHSIGSDLSQPNAAVLSWVLTAYAITFAAPVNHDRKRQRMMAENGSTVVV